MPRLIFCRHGRTHYNAAGRFQGWLDTELDELGRSQAAALGEFLRSELAGAKLKIFSSPLRRAKDTAAAFCAAEKITILDSLKEIDHGEWDDQLASEVDQAALAIWKAAPHTVAAGPGGESLAQVQERAMSAVRTAASSLESDEVGVFFAHDAVIRTIALAVLNAPLSSFNALQLHNCSACVIDYAHTAPASGALGSGGGEFTLIHFNLSAHTGHGLLGHFHQAAL